MDNFESPIKLDVLVIGAGMYGLHAAKLFQEANLDFMIVEDRTENDTLHEQMFNQGSASLVNQARVHNGYHYPRSLGTAKHSAKQFDRFVDEYKDAVITDFNQFYGIEKKSSKTSAKQFEKFAKDVDIPLDVQRSSDFNYQHIDETYLTKEYAIDTSKMLKIARSGLQDRIVNDKIFFATKSDYGWFIQGTRHSYLAKVVINATYSKINDVLDSFSLNKLPLRYQIAEEVIVENVNNKNALTIMDGPFASFMPYTNNSWSITSVPYTPVIEFDDDVESHIHDYLSMRRKKIFEDGVNKDFIIKSASRYMSDELLEHMKFVRTIWTVKTLYDSSKYDDSRFVLIDEQDHVYSILGAKLNAIYDIDDTIDSIIKNLNVNEDKDAK